MRRFLLHVLPSGFHRIRHYGLLANAGRRENLAKVRCPDCGAAMVVIETFGRGQQIRAPPLLQGAS
jgi:hypothetical protein